MILRIVFFAFAVSAVPALYAQCGDTTHTASAGDTWASCQRAANPNASRGPSHWIMYDFGQVYALSNTHFWNANETGATEMGFRQTAIDYSLDGVTWVSLGTFEMPRATGYGSYTGAPGPDFGDAAARYVVLTALSNWGHPSCYGLGEVRFSLSGATSSETLMQPGAISLYPNPVTEWLRLDYGDVQPVSLRVVQLDGRILQEFDGAIPETLSVQRYAPGIYFVSVIDRNGNYFSKAFVKH